MAEISKEYIEALKALLSKWENYLEFHAYLHEGEEHDHTLEEVAIELEKLIISTYEIEEIEEIGKYTEQGMMDEVNKMRALPPRQFTNSVFTNWNILPHHDVRRELELVIAKSEANREIAEKAIMPVELREGSLEAFDGEKWHTITDAQLYILKKLNEEPGTWVPGKKIKSVSSKERIGRRVQNLPPKIKKRIISHTRNGYRLT